MTGEEHAYTIRVHRESAGDIWAEVAELPGCFLPATI
jgi:predicted RNase H-like HicB family nuclease